MPPIDTTSLPISESQLIHDALTLSQQLPISIKAALAFTEDGQLLLVTEKAERSQIQFIDPSAASLAFQEGSVDSGWLPPQTVRHGQTLKDSWVVQFYPPQKYPFSLQIDSQFCPLPDLEGAVSVTVPFPRLLFLAKGQSAYLWAVKQKTFNSKQRLYQVPLPNADSSGELCFGSNLKPSASIDTVERIWQTWWGGIFNHHTIGGKSKQHPQDIRWQLWESKGKKGYPVKDLVESRYETAQKAVEFVVGR